MRQSPWSEQLRSERALLAKAERDIAQGWLRLRRQQQLVALLRAGRHPSPASDHLLAVTSQVLIEWERHRSLIVQRIAYLEEQILEGKG